RSHGRRFANGEPVGGRISGDARPEDSARRKRDASQGIFQLGATTGSSAKPPPGARALGTDRTSDDRAACQPGPAGGPSIAGRGDGPAMARLEGPVSASVADIAQPAAEAG